MDVVALILWILAAGGGFYLLATWIAKGGARPGAEGASRFPPAVIFGHFGLAAAGLVVWIIYMIADVRALAWISFIVLVVVAVLGLTMLLRWVPSYRTQHQAVGVKVGAGSSTGAVVPAEAHFPVAVVGLHGLFAVATVVVVLLAALNV
ncbi:hypothetical protein CLV47_101459 [Antricoccus suffuscus]|uniref:DUF2269 family protein n=1 Tax=Antricoccus suffuscus TaxID=1629062 RepID=A0A2T1A6V1_9ACTN|nr:hypothetical protein [Antricoccus suffuscus]PRZ44333.1 hypothetical protein CLV47_101459 [Antricoccus suffuscus]